MDAEVTTADHTPVRAPRYDETFPTLTTTEIDRLRRFGALRRYADGEKLFEAGQPSPGMFVLIVSTAAIAPRHALERPLSPTYLSPIVR